jgi:hypothetical protein
MAGLKRLRGQGPERLPTQPRETPGAPYHGGMKMKGGLSGLSTGRGTALGPSKQAGEASPQPRQRQTPQGLPWGYGGVNPRPMAVPALEEDAIDLIDVFDVYEVCDEYEDSGFEDLIEYLDNQRWWMGIRRIPKILKPFKKLKKVNDRINVFIEATSLDFGWMVGWRVSTAIDRRFKLTADQAYPIFKIFNALGYWSMKILLAFAVTAPFSIPISLLISYFYANLLINNPMAYNVYATQLFTLPMEAIA